jgi:N-hydroxyarylamine O-acetyltransferase
VSGPDLEAYFERIGYAGARTPDGATLEAVMQAHLAAIPFENLDVQLGRPTAHDLPTIFAKLVASRRGGWCYEQNGLLGWALGALGFDVVRLAGGVMRAAAGDATIGNHLALLVTVGGQPWLVDAGFGGSLAAPIPLAPARHSHPPYDLVLAQLDDGYWRYEEYADGKPFSFDFRAEPGPADALARHQARLQVAADSPFVLNLVAQRRIGDRHLSLRGRVLAEMGPDGVEERLLDDAGALVATLRERFALDVPEIATCWPTIQARHEAVFG